MFSSRSVCLAFITRQGCPPNLTSSISRDSDSTYNIFIIKMSKHEKPTKIYKSQRGRKKGNKLKRVHFILTPRAKVDDEELRNVISSDDWLSEYRFEQNTKYNDIVVMKIA